jgi:hypothetical protein
MRKFIFENFWSETTLSVILEDAMTILESIADKHVCEDVYCLELAQDIIQ